MIHTKLMYLDTYEASTFEQKKNSGDMSMEPLLEPIGCLFRHQQNVMMMPLHI